MVINGDYPLGNEQKTMEHQHFPWVKLSFKWAIFDCYVSLPEGIDLPG